jgi:hypothetical protein
VQKQVQKAQNIVKEMGKVEIRVKVEELATGGANFKHVTVDKTTIKDIVQKFAVKNGDTKGIDNVKQGDKSSLAPGAGLAAHELKGGHLIERHVGKTDEELLERLKSNPKITGSSTFIDRVAAEKVANTVLINPKNIEKIQKWLSDPNSRPTLPLRYKGDGKIIGRSVSEIPK